MDESDVPDCQVTLTSDANVLQIRDLNVISIEVFREARLLTALTHALHFSLPSLVNLSVFQVLSLEPPLSAPVPHTSTLCVALVAIPRWYQSAVDSRVLACQECVISKTHQSIVTTECMLWLTSATLILFSSQSEDRGKPSCPMDPYVIVHDKCSFVDSQVLKLQEAPDMVPVGDLPRHTILNADR
jgi:DNA replication licensing factor MCM5